MIPIALRRFRSAPFVDDSSVQIESLIAARGFDPTAVEQLELEELVSAKRTGRLMKSFMGEVHYEMQPGVKNELKMVKRLKKGER